MPKFKTSCAVLAYLSSNLLNKVGSLFRYFEVGLRVCDIVVKKFTFAISSPDEFLYLLTKCGFWFMILGPKGPTGDVGAPGETGFTGEQGIVGLPGSTGIMGSTGDSGTVSRVGATGRRGPIGQVGVRGAPGRYTLFTYIITTSSCYTNIVWRQQEQWSCARLAVYIARAACMPRGLYILLASISSFFK